MKVKNNMAPCYQASFVGFHLASRVKSWIPDTERSQQRYKLQSEANDPGRGEREKNRRDRAELSDRSGAHLGDVLHLGEPEGHPEAAEEHGDEGTGVAEGRDAELAAVGVHPAHQLLERLGHRRQRRLHPLARRHDGRHPFAQLLRRRLRLRRRPRHLPEPEHPVPSSPYLLSLPPETRDR
jgi:hypothetical protein